MRRILLSISLVIFLISVVSAIDSTVCSPNVILLNQDPYPTIPGETVKVVFQIQNLDNPKCGTVNFEFLPEYPVSLTPETPALVTIKSSTFVPDYKSFVQVPYKLIVDKSAPDKDTTIKTRISSTTSDLYIINEFNLTVDDTKADFEVSIKDYNPTTNIITFEILNIGENDIEALTVDIPKQDNINVKGSTRNIVGSLDSNEDTTFTFEGIPKNGQINLLVSYTDIINERRSLDKSVTFDSDLFTDRANSQKKNNYWIYIIIVVIIILIIFFYRRSRRKKLEALRLHKK